MIVLTVLLVLCSSFGQYICDYDSDCKVRGKEPLDDLVVTWAPPNVNNPWAFSHLPTTAEKAQAQNWTDLDDGCKDSASKHKGKRYILGDDVSVLIIYDGQGRAAGIQVTIPKDLADVVKLVDYKKLSFVYYERIREQDRYVLTTYFVNPDSVCGGRTKEVFEAEGTAKQLYMQYGTNNYFTPPIFEDKHRLAEINWAEAVCVETMGNHYYYKGNGGQKGSDARPFFLVYDCGRLIAIELFLIGNFTEPRFEYVTIEQMKPFFDRLPQSLRDVYAENTDGFASFHFFFTRDPQKVSCPK